MIDPEEIENRFSYHSPTPEQVVTMVGIRETAKNLAHLINVACPDSREKSTALTKLDETVMHANAAIARREGQE